MSEERHGRSSRLAPDPLAEIERIEDEGVVIIVITGELDVSNVGELAEIAYEVGNEALGLVLDLSDATYIDSATIGLLFKLHAALHRRGQALRLVCPPGSSARRVLELTGFDEGTQADNGDRRQAIDAIRREIPLRR